jgi:hypothetical protein
MTKQQDNYWDFLIRLKFILAYLLEENIIDRMIQ